MISKKEDTTVREKITALKKKKIRFKNKCLYKTSKNIELLDCRKLLQERNHLKSRGFMDRTKNYQDLTHFRKKRIYSPFCLYKHYEGYVLLTTTKYIMSGSTNLY